MRKSASADVFTVDQGHLDDLGAVEATALFRDLLWCEVDRIGLSTHRVSISLNTTVADGGIDATVRDTPASDSLLLKGSCFFQIKTGTAFKPWTESSIHKELFGKAGNPANLKSLAPSVAKCCKAGGHYVIVDFGHDLTAPQVRDAETLARKALSRCGFKKPAVTVIGQTQLVGLIKAFPSLVHRLQGLEDRFFLDHEMWRTQALMTPALHLGEAQAKLIGTIQELLDTPAVQHIRLIGEPGIGKTRLVLEAVSTAAYAPLVLYAPAGDEFQRSRLMLDLTRADRRFRALIVVDECPEKERASIWSLLKNREGIKLITLDHGPEHARDDAMRVLSCPPLSDQEVENILRSYVTTREPLKRWAQMCEGSPRVAHAVGENLRSNPDDVLQPPATVPIWSRFIAGYQAIDSTEARQTLMIMRHLALFLKFGFEHPVGNEAQHVATLVQAADPQITWPVFQQHVQRMRDKRILQGRRTLIIVPKLLHLHLWREFWESYGRGFDYEGALKAMPDSLRYWFTTLFSYAHTNPVALSVVERLLADGGYFQQHADDLLRSDSGSRFFGALTEAHPEAAVELLKRTVARWSNDTLKEWKTGRQMVVWALERIAVWAPLFRSAVDVLVPMVKAETANHSNNSTGILMGLFVVGVGWAPTQASPTERFVVLQDLLKSSDPGTRVLAISMCKSWLRTYGGTRIVGAEHQGLRPTIQFWRPKKYDEVFDAWRQAWQLLFLESRSWDVEHRQLANAVLIETGVGLVRYQVLTVEVIDTWKALAADNATNRAALCHAIVSAQRVGAKLAKPSVLRPLRQLDKHITGKSFWSRFERYVMFPNWEEAWLLRPRGEGEEALTARVKSLVRELTKSPALLRANLARLVRAEGTRVSEFADLLARQSATPRLTKKVIDLQQSKQQDNSAAFFGGYISGLRLHSVSDWEAALAELLADPSTSALAVSAIRSSGLSAGLLEKVTALVAAKKIDPQALGGIAWRTDADEFGEASIWLVMEALVSEGSREALTAALELADRYYCRLEKPRPFGDEAVIEKLLIDLTLSRQLEEHSNSYHWELVAKEFCRRFPERELPIFTALLSSIAHDETWHIDQPSLLAYEIAKRRPSETWQQVASALCAKTLQVFWLRAWLEGQHPIGQEPEWTPLCIFPQQEVIDWVLADREKRAEIVAACLPCNLAGDAGELSRLFIENVIDSDNETDNLIWRFSHASGFVGKRSENFRRKRDAARGWLAASTSVKVTRWLERYLRSLDAEIDRAEMEEERRGH